MFKQYGLLIFYVMVALFMFLVSCAKKNTTTLERRPPILLQEISQEDFDVLPEEDTSVNEEVIEEDLLDDDGQ